MSYIENALTSNPVLAPLANRELDDVYRFIRVAQGEEIPGTEFAHAYSATERQEIIGVLEKLLRIQQVVLAVNLQYIASAAQQDAYRTEPPFKLQGSYRNMNKMAEKVVAIMNQEELEQLIDDHYRGEAQTLTTGAEENILKLGDLRGTLSGERLERWEEIKSGFRRIQSGGGEEMDPVTRVANQLGGIAMNLEGLQKGITRITGESKDRREDESEARALLVGQLDAMGKELTHFLTGLQSTLENAQMNVQVVNKPVPGMKIMLEQLTHAYDETLLPLMKSLHHKLSLDEAIWRQVTESRKLLQDIDQRILAQGSTTTEQIKPLENRTGAKPTDGE